MALPITPTVSTYTISENFLSLATDNKADVKDIGIYGTFLSSGTKYAVLYREASTGRFRVGTTINLPSDTITGLISGDFECNTAYTGSLFVSGLTANQIIASDASKNLTTNSKVPKTLSYANFYITAGFSSSSLTANTWYYPGQQGLTLVLGNASSDFTLSTGAANRGFRYTGPNAVVEITTYIATTDAQPYAAITAGLSPLPPAAPNVVARQPYIGITRCDFNENDTVTVSFITTISTNHEIAFYLASSRVFLTLFSWFGSVNVLYYL